jgi:hypothetical protein
VLTAGGGVRLRRVYFVCSACRTGSHPLDERLGVDGSTSVGADRLLCLAGASWSFDAAARNLDEFCGLRTSDTTIRAVCLRRGGDVERWRADEPAAGRPFRQARGEVEFTTDGTCVNTTGGWREMRLAVFAKRFPGEPANPNQWDQRELPKPTARCAVARIESADDFAARWPVIAGRLGIKSRQPLDVTADGARWIWDRVATYWPHARGTLDVYHALEHVAAAAKALYGEGTEPARRWHDATRAALLAEGHVGIERQIQAVRVNAVRGAQRQALDALQTYFDHQKNHLDYAERLAAGRPIGSGLVEGACKNFVGRRLKQTGARWRPENANRLADLAGLLYSHDWKHFWN